MTEVANIRDLSRSFGRRPVLNGIHLATNSGEFVAFLGRSGLGKSTLLRVLAGLDTAPANELRIPQRRAVVFQEPRLMPWKTVIDNVTLGATKVRSTGKAKQVLTDVGLLGRMNACPLTLSGGEAQRAALVRALVCEPQLLLLDEPIATLDALTRMHMHDLVLDLWRKHRPAILLVTHDVWEAVALADCILVLDQGRFMHDLRVNIDHPRQRTDKRAAAMETELLDVLDVRHITLPN